MYDTSSNALIYCHVLELSDIEPKHLSHHLQFLFVEFSELH